MKELRQKQEFKSWLYSLPALILLILFTFFLARGAASIMTKERESSDRLEELEEANALLKERQANLTGSIARLETDEGIINEIRRKFNVTRKGEHLAIVVEGEDAVPPPPQSAIKRGWSWFKALWTF